MTIDQTFPNTHPHCRCIPSPIEVIENKNMQKTQWKQVRFPKSKKKRIRKKWSKRPINWGFVPTYMAISFMGKLYVNTPMYQKIKNINNDQIPSNRKHSIS